MLFRSIPKIAPDRSKFVLDKKIKKGRCVNIGDILGMYLAAPKLNADDLVDGYLASPNYTRDTQSHREDHIPAIPDNNRIHIGSMLSSTSSAPKFASVTDSSLSITRS